MNRHRNLFFRRFSLFGRHVTMRADIRTWSDWSLKVRTERSEPGAIESAFDKFDVSFGRLALMIGVVH
jgi:hypothetical protein